MATQNFQENRPNADDSSKTRYRKVVELDRACRLIENKMYNK